MTDRMAIVPVEATDKIQAAIDHWNIYGCNWSDVLAASPNAGKLSPAQLKAAVDAMGGCDLPYLPRARREIFARATAKAWGLEIA